MSNFSGPYSREIEYLDKIADILLGPDDLIHNVGDRRTFALQRLMEFVIREGSGAYRNVQADWNAPADSESAILNKPDGIPVDPDYVHTEENFTTEHRNKLENIEHFAQHNVQADWTEENPESDAYIKNVPDDIVQDGDYVHTDFNFNEHYKDMLDYHVITDDYYTPEDSEKLAGIEWNATHTDIEDELDPDSTNPVESRVIYNWMETKVDKEDGYALSKNDFTDELKEKLDAIEEEANKIIVDSELDNTSTNPVENQVVCAALDTKVDKAEDQSLMTRAEHLKLEGIEEQANRTIPDENITANSHNVVESRAIYEALDTKVNKINGKGLSENDFTDAYRNKLDNIDDHADNTIVDAQVTEASMNPVTSNAIYTELEKKVDKEDGKSLLTDEERIKLGKFDPDAPKVTIVDIVLNGSSGKYDMLSLTWQQCKDAISNGILYCKDSLGEIQAVSFCYSVETEDRDGEPVYRAEFASFNNEYYAFFEAEAPNKRPVFVGSENVKPDLSGKVDKTTKVNGHALDTDVSITPNDIDHSFNRAYDNGTIGASLKWLRDYKADKGTLINGHSLEEDVVVTASDIAFDPESDYLDGSIGDQVRKLIDHDAELDVTAESLNQTKADKTTKINGYALNNDITLGSNDIGYSAEENYKAGTVGRAIKERTAADESLEQRKADKTTTVNGHPLSENVVVNASDIAYSDESNYTAGSIGEKVKNLNAAAGNLGEDKVDKTTTVNGHQLSQNVVVDPDDITYNPDASYGQETLGFELQRQSAEDRRLQREKVDKTTTVNGHALSENVVVGAGDIEFQSDVYYNDGSIGDNVSKLNKNKVDKIAGKGLSTEDFTSEFKEKLEGIEAGSQVNIIESIIVNGDAKPISDKSVDLFIPTKTSDIANDSDFVSHADLSNAAPNMDGIASAGESQNFARADHIHPTDATRAPVESPALTGTPTAPTAEKGTDTSQIATTAFVQEAISDKANAEDVYTKRQVDNKLTAVYHLKGTKRKIEDLPMENNEVGDVWHISSNGTEYFWNGSEWEYFGEIIDLTGYVYDTEYVHTDNNFTDAFKSKLVDLGQNDVIATQDYVDSAFENRTVNGHSLRDSVVVGAGDIEYSSEEDYSHGSIGDKLSELDENKVDKIDGKGLSTNDFTNAHKQKVESVESGAQVNVIEKVVINGTRQAVNDKTVSFSVPTKTSDIENDSDFMAYDALSNTNPVVDGAPTPGVSNKVSREDHVHPTDQTRAPIESPTFSGVPKAATAAKGTNSTQLATTAFVQTAVADKANAADVYTKQEVDEKFTSVYRLKGTKPDADHLPTEGNVIGDVWHISTDGTEYFWNGTEWEFLGKITDLAGYVYDTEYSHIDNNYTDAEKAKLAGIEAGANKTIVDSELTSSSTNPVENRVVTAAIEVKVDKETGKGLSTNDYTTEEKTKLAYIEAEANKTIVDTQLSGDSTNPIENRAVKHGLDEKVDKVPGMALSHNDFTDSYKAKLDGVETGGQVNVIESISVNGTRQAVNDKSVNIVVPTKVSDLSNDQEFLSRSEFHAATPIVDGVGTPGVSNTVARGDHVHPTDTSRAPIDSPAFSGTPKAPTAAKGTSTTQIASTAFVQNAIADKANADDVYTKQQIDTKLTAVYRLKGVQPDVAHLPQLGNEVGDVWHVSSDGTEYFWNGSEWEFLGKIVDLTGYVYDTDYVHTDNNFTDALKSKIDVLGENDVVATEDYVDNAVSERALANNVYTKTEVDNKLVIVFRYKGVKEHISDLHYNANEIGDVWTVDSESWDFYWTGTEWKRVGGHADFTGYAYDPNYVHTDENFTSELKDKLEDITTGSLVNVQSDWAASGGEEEILNKPLINNVELVSGNNTLQSLGIDIATEQSIDDLFN